MTQGQIVFRESSLRETYADFFVGLNEEQKLVLSMLGVGWIPNCSVFLGASRYDDDDPEIHVPIAHGPWKLGVYLPSMQPPPDHIAALLQRGWVVVELGSDCIERWRNRPDLFKKEFIFGTLRSQKAATQVKWKPWLAMLQEIT